VNFFTSDKTCLTKRIAVAPNAKIAVIEILKNRNLSVGSEK
jgi:hypothetical protein